MAKSKDAAVAVRRQDCLTDSDSSDQETAREAQVSVETPPAENTAGAAPAPEPAQREAPALENELKSITELADFFRLPTWQSAALHRLMGWAPGKRVTEAAYKAGLARLKNRRIGG
jgi:hypothetical protein